MYVSPQGSTYSSKRGYPGTSPQGSTYSSKREDILELLDIYIANFSTQGQCFVCGDFNARTGIEPDYIVNDSQDNLSIPQYYMGDSPMPRNNMEQK